MTIVMGDLNAKVGSEGGNATWLANMVQGCEMSMVNDGFSGAKPTTKSLPTLGLNITPED